MPYVQLANGQTKKLSNEEFTKAFGDEPPRAYRDGGKEHMVVGVYPEEIEYELTAEEKANRGQTPEGDRKGIK